jgi:hypothetical protein
MGGVEALEVRLRSEQRSATRASDEHHEDHDEDRRPAPTENAHDIGRVDTRPIE